MDEFLHALLIESDSATEWDFPEGFDWRASMNDLRRFRKAAFERLGLEFTVDDQVQDASFFADLFCATYLGRGVGIRFSNFGHLVMIFTDDVRRFSSEHFPQELIDLLLEYKFKVVRPEDLQEAVYDGSHPKLRGEITWFTRYFDYL